MHVVNAFENTICIVLLVSKQQFLVDCTFTIWQPSQGQMFFLKAKTTTIL
jgi:hypothetical protein